MVFKLHIYFHQIFQPSFFLLCCLKSSIKYLKVVLISRNFSSFAFSSKKKSKFDRNSKMTSSTSTKQGNKESKRVKKEPKESKPLTKIIVRRLPPKLVEEEFLEAVDPIAEHDYFR